MKAEAKHRGGFGGQDRRLVAHCGDSIEMHSAQAGHRFRDAIEFHCYSAVAPRVFHHVTAVRGQREINSKAARGIGKNPDLISRSRGEEEQVARH